MPTHYHIRRIEDQRFFVGPRHNAWSLARRSAQLFKSKQEVDRKLQELKDHGHICSLEEKHIPDPPKAPKTTREAADLIIAKLKAKGFIIQRYNAYSTNSIYLKLNYGYSHSIRISDHAGKAHLAYRYNVIFGGKRGHKVVKQRNTFRNFYSEHDVNQMIKAIIAIHEDHIKKYGEKNVAKYIQERYDQNKDKQVGFWADAWEV